MTQHEGESPDSGQVPPAAPGDPIAAIEPVLDPALEAELRGILANLPPLEMPDDVYANLMSAIEAEPHPAYEPVRSHKVRNGLFVAIGGVAAVGILGMFVGAGFLYSPSNDLPTLASVSMSMSNTVYEGNDLANEVSAKIPSWQASRHAVGGVSSPIATTSASASELSSPAASASSIPSESASSSADVPPSVRAMVAECLHRVDSRQMMHVDIAHYKATPTSAPEQVAVAAVEGDHSYDIYVVPVNCNGAGAQLVRNHIQLAER